MKSLANYIYKIEMIEGTVYMRDTVGRNMYTPQILINNTATKSYREILVLTEKHWRAAAYRSNG